MLQNAAFQTHKQKNQNEKSRARHELGIDDASDDFNFDDDDDDNDDGDNDGGAPLTATGAFSLLQVVEIHAREAEAPSRILLTSHSQS
jgi:hypothetical protein